MKDDKLKPISAERWSTKFTGDFNVTPPSPELSEIFEKLDTGTLSSDAAEARLIQIGFSPREARLIVIESKKEESELKCDFGDE